MKKPLFLVLALSLGLAASAVTYANVARLAPNFAWEGAGGKTNLRSVKGQPVVLLIARNARVGAFRKQLKELKSIYQEFAGRKVIFAAAIAEGPAEVRSDIPFAIVTNGAQVAAAYETNDKFNIAIIGPDGNVDYQTSRVVPAYRVRDVISNTFEKQAAERK